MQHIVLLKFGFLPEIIFKGFRMKLGTAYFANRILRHVRKDMETLHHLGFDFVVHTFSEFDLQFHYGNLQQIVKVSQECGLQVYLDPWGIGNVFGGEAYSDFVTEHFEDGCQVLENGTLIHLACPNSPVFQQFLLTWTEAALTTGADGIFWDEPHFNHPDYLKSVADHWACRCRHCQKKYQEQFGQSMPLVEDESVQQFKQKSLVDFLLPLFDLTHQQGRQNILYLPPPSLPEQARSHFETFARLPVVDTLSTGLYWQMANRPVEDVGIYALILKTLADSFGKDHLYWIQNLRIIAGREDEIARAMHICHQNGIRNFAVWCFEGGEHESWAACANPSLAWRTAINTYKKMKNHNHYGKSQRNPIN